MWFGEGSEESPSLYVGWHEILRPGGKDTGAQNDKLGYLSV